MTETRLSQKQLDALRKILLHKGEVTADRATIEALLDTIEDLAGIISSLHGVMHQTSQLIHALENAKVSETVRRRVAAIGVELVAIRQRGLGVSMREGRG